MTTPAFGEISQDHRGDWVRLRTMTYVRMLALSGQVAALLVAHFHFGLRFDVALVGLVVGAAGLSVLSSLMLFPQTKRLSEAEAFLTFLFDIALLVCLLYLTGGITNPFSLLILAPVAVAAMALRPRSALILSLIAIALVTLIAFSYQPLRFADGTVLSVPALFAFGFWAAIVIGILFQAFYAHRIVTEGTSLANALLAAQMALSREQKLTDLGGVVAAAAHELGTPLATIKLIAAELAEEVQDRPDLAEDARILREQADRCRDILRSMGRAGKDDLHLRRAPVEAVLQEAAEPHLARGKAVQFRIAPGPGGAEEQPVILRRPEIIHGLRNLIQNAVDFAQAKVAVQARWTDRHLSLRISDDGPGFPPQLIGYIGEPFIRRRRDPTGTRRRPGYEGMGLGLFIAKTLLERSGAVLEFSNAEARGDDTLGGAQITVVWPLERIVVDPAAPLGENMLLPP
ncbi:sensor histidine kinase RegB [Natronohydrobacter thiooxidans]|uniref:sensor histidine kinase RegB n=1 Tax=Natronohydrobacter thiooxidans TaxID=87172 RepID=UPI0008FF1ADE|nr:ActS/PrrB/RegB family redox-sensitive histidine kinase [Natronohydrobacter thiooxidans]